MAEPVYKKAILAGGCFWCMEPPYEKLAGVVDVVSGYTGGDEVDPTYEQVSSGLTGHYEAVEITYDPDKISYEKILHVFWRNIDPLNSKGQFCDTGPQYRSAIFYLNDNQKVVAEASRQKLDLSGILPEPVTTEILPAKPFYPAEDYHQDYYRKNMARYKFYRYLCGRDKRLHQLWGEDASKDKPGYND